jgi:hypothetical protein
VQPSAAEISAAFFMPKGKPTSTMPDPLTGWLSHVDLLLALLASISVSLAVIFHNVDRVLGSLPSMWNRVRSFRRPTAVPVRSRKRAVTHRRAKRNPKSSSTPT